MDNSQDTDYDFARMGGLALVFLKMTILLKFLKQIQMAMQYFAKEIH